MQKFISMSSHDALYARDCNAGDYHSGASEPNSTWDGIDHEIYVDAFPQGALEVFAAGKRFYPNEQFPVLFDPNDVSILLGNISALTWVNGVAFEHIKNFIQSIIGNGECLAISINEI